MLFSFIDLRRILVSNQPHLLSLPVVAPFSPPHLAIFFPNSPSSSEGNGPWPTRVVYAFVIPNEYSISVGLKPVPDNNPANVVLDEVTYGYVP